VDKKFYITTTLPYVNAEPHIGFALEIVQADVVARYHKLLGEDVIFNFGTDEHGQKIYQKALEAKSDPQKYCDKYAVKFDNLKKALNLSYTNFIRTTGPHHIVAAQEFWKKCLDNDDIYKKTYRQKYCVGCELEKTDSELVDNKCPLHPNKELEIIEEENYFFKFSRYQRALLELYKNSPDFVIPQAKLNEIKIFVENGLQDFSISRLKSKMPWGIPVPNDPDQVMYVWFDALISYISTLGWPEDEKNFNDFWPGIQVAGKDNLRQQTAIWQAMLLSADLPNSKQVFIHGFITVNGQKISKSLGNVVNPFDLVEKYGTDAVRYFLLAKINPYDDSDFTIKKFEEAYNADLANGLGNLISRIAKLCEKIKFQLVDVRSTPIKPVWEALDSFKFDKSLEIIWNEIKNLDKEINDKKPWEYPVKDGVSIPKQLSSFLLDASVNIVRIANHLRPFIPQTAGKILDQFTKGPIKVGKPLFPRLK